MKLPLYSFVTIFSKLQTPQVKYLPELLSLECNSIRLGGHTHGIVTKTVYKTLPGGGGGRGGGLGVVGV